MQSKSHVSTTTRNSSDFSGPFLVPLSWTDANCKVSFGLTSHITKSFWKSCMWWNQHLWCGCVIVPMAWVTITSVTEPFMLEGAYRFWNNICCNPGDTKNVPAPGGRYKATFYASDNSVASELKSVGSSVACLNINMLSFYYIQLHLGWMGKQIVAFCHYWHLT